MSKRKKIKVSIIYPIVFLPDNAKVLCYSQGNMKNRRRSKPASPRKSVLKRLRAFLKRNGNMIAILLQSLSIIVAMIVPSCHDNRQVIENEMETEEREECVVESIYFSEISDRAGGGSCACPNAEKD